MNGSYIEMKEYMQKQDKKEQQKIKQPNTTQEKALIYLYKKLKHARIALGKSEQKKGAESEIEGLKNKIDVLEWLTGIVLKEDSK